MTLRDLPFSGHRPLVRGAALGVLHIAVRAGLAWTVANWTPVTSVARWAALLCVVLVAAAWGVVDGRRAGDNEDPAEDLTLMWLFAAAGAAVCSAVGVWLSGFVPGTYSAGDSAAFELTVGVAWILLVTFIPAVVGVAAGRAVKGRGPSWAAATQGGGR